MFPDGIDLQRFDRSLFNLDLLQQQNLTDNESASVPLIVTTPEGTEDAGLDSLEASLADTSGVTVRARLTSIDAVAVAVNKSQTAPVYRWLAGSELVGSVTLDRRYAVTLDEVRQQTSVDAARAEHNVSGEGVVVAVVDSGIDQSHPDIDQVRAERDFTDDGTPAIAEDPFGHGTHVAGILAGDGTASDGQYRGVAPNTTLLDVRVLDDQGHGSTSAIVRAINWSVDQGADVISLSLGGPARYERPNDPFRAAIQRAIDQNVTVVVSAGNAGNDPATITSPGTLAGPITVGATTKNGDVAYFSSRGPTPNSLAVKPTLVAPGASVVSTASGQAGYDVEYVSMSGTSMSAPVVSGIAALLHERSPGLTPQETKRRLAATADPIDGPTVYSQGTGQVNATRALNASTLLSPPVRSLGTYANNTTATTTLTLHNERASTRTYSLNATAVGIETGQRAAVSLNRTTVTVGPGNRTAVELTIQTGTTTDIYSGRVEVLNGTGTAVFGFARVSEVTIEKSAIGNGTTDGDWVTLLSSYGGAYSVFRAVRIEGNNTTTSIVRSGNLTVVSSGVDETTGRPVVLTRTVSVNGSRTVVLNESQTVLHGLNTTALQPTTTPLRTVVTYRVSTPRGTYTDEVRSRRPDSTGIRFSTAGEVAVTTEHLLGSAGANATGFDRDRLYDLVHTTNNVTGPTTHQVDPDTLGVLNVSYRRAGGLAPFDVTLVSDTGGPRESQFDHRYTGVLGDRRAQTIHVSQGVERVGVVVRQNGTGGWTYQPYEADITVPAGGTERAVTRNDHPLWPATEVTVDESNGSVTVDASPATGRSGAWVDDGQSDSVTVTVNGQRVSETDIEGPERLTQSVDANDTVVVQSRTRTQAFTLSRHTMKTTEFTVTDGTEVDPAGVSFHSATGQDNGSTVGLDDANRLPPGKLTVSLLVDLPPSRIESARIVYAPVNDSLSTLATAPLSDDRWQATNLTLTSYNATHTRVVGNFSTNVSSPVALGVAVRTVNGSRTRQAVVPAFTVAEDGAFGPPTDLDGDGVTEDVTGDGTVDRADAERLFDAHPVLLDRRYASGFDVNGDGRFDILDVQALLALAREDAS